MQRNPAIALAPSLGQLAVKPRDHLIELQLNPGDFIRRSFKLPIPRIGLSQMIPSTKPSEQPRYRSDRREVPMRNYMGVLTGLNLTFAWCGLVGEILCDGNLFGPSIWLVIWDKLPASAN